MSPTGTKRHCYDTSVAGPSLTTYHDEVSQSRRARDVLPTSKPRLLLLAPQVASRGISTCYLPLCHHCSTEKFHNFL